MPSSIEKEEVPELGSSKRPRLRTPGAGGKGRGDAKLFIGWALRERERGFVRRERVGKRAPQGGGVWK